MLLLVVRDSFTPDFFFPFLNSVEFVSCDCVCVVVCVLERVLCLLFKRKVVCSFGNTTMDKRNIVIFLQKVIKNSYL